VSELQKHMLSSAVGAGIGAAACLLLSPALWWLGILAGFAGGYLSYEFREVRVVTRRIALERLDAEIEGCRRITVWLRKPHPFWLVAVVGCAGAFGLVQYSIRGLMADDPVFYDEGWVFGYLMCAIVIVVSTFALTLIWSGIFLTLAVAGARKKKTRWRPGEFWDIEEKVALREQFKNDYLQYLTCEDDERLRKKMGPFKEWAEVPPTYGNIFFLAVVGVGVCIWRIVSSPVTLPIIFGRGVWRIICLIHNDHRLVCGMDAAFAVVIVFWYLISHQVRFSEHDAFMEFLFVLHASSAIGAIIGLWHFRCAQWLRLKFTLQT
jgi:hypothetical protein